MKTYQLRKNFRLIPDHHPYAINVFGNVYNFIDDKNCDCVLDDNGNTCYLLNDMLCDVRQLLLDTFIGHLDAPIVYRGHKSNWTTVNDLSYSINGLKQISEDPLEYELANIKFRQHPYYTDLLVGENGVIMRLPDFQFIRVWQSPSHYPRIQRHSGNKTLYTRAISHLVYETWIGDIPNGMVVDHKDDIVYHSHWSNLQLMTQKDNIHKSYKTGGKSDKTYFDTETLEKMCQLMSEGRDAKDISVILGIEYNKYLCSIIMRLHKGIAYPEIASKYNFDAYDPNSNRHSIPSLVREQIIADVKNGMRAVDLHKKYSMYGPQSIDAVYTSAGLKIYTLKLTPYQIECVKQRLAAGYTVKSIADEFDVTRETITKIKMNKYGKM